MPEFFQSEMKVIKPDGAILGSPDTLAIQMFSKRITSQWRKLNNVLI